MNHCAATCTNEVDGSLFFAPGERETDRLEAEITELWAQLNAATFRFLELVAEFDRDEGWLGHGVANCAQWLNLKCGIGPVAAREKVRVARALESLPAISDAFRHGQLSYSKVRAMTRVATEANEETLLNVALNGTASHVERLVRKFWRVERLEDAADAMTRNRARYLDFGYDDDGSVTIRGRLTPEVGMLVKRAIEIAMTDDVSAETNEHDEHYQYSERNAESPIAARRSDALELIARQFLNDGAKDAGPSDRYQVVVHVDQTALTTGDGRSEIEDGPELAIDTARRLACDGHLVGLVEDSDGMPLNIGRRTRAITNAMRRALKARDGGCRFPGCDHTRFTDAHHIHHWADGGETSLANLVTLCSFHHTLIHEGGFGLRVTDDRAFIFTRPDGTRIGPNIVHKCFRGNIDHINTERGIEVQQPPGWHGERMDYGLAVEALSMQR
jgi:hypothetical protein